MVLNTFEEKLMSSTYLMLIERFSVLEIHPNAKKRCFFKGFLVLQSKFSFSPMGNLY